MLRVKIADPMSGFFMIRRDRFEQLAPQLSTQGFKILLDIVATARGELRRSKEIPSPSARGCTARASSIPMVALDFLGLVLAKLTHDVVSLRFLLFAMVGSIGLFVHLARAVRRARSVQCAVSGSAGCGALVAMTSNFILNNFLTYRDQRLKGFAILRGLLLFYLVCSVGPVRQCRRRVLGLRSGADLVAGRCGGRADGRGMELRDVRTVRLAQAMNVSDESERGAARPQHGALTILALVALRLVAAA